MSDYEDIIDLSHHVSKHHAPMSMGARAAQFAPFAALTGHHAALDESARKTEDQIDPDADSLEMLNRNMTVLLERIREQPRVRLVYFKPDDRKSGGKYVQIEGSVVKLAEYEQCLEIAAGDKKTKISFQYILECHIIDD